MNYLISAVHAAPNNYFYNKRVLCFSFLEFNLVDDETYQQEDAQIFESGARIVMSYPPMFLQTTQQSKCNVS